jgi:CO dehydrogenase maturation factor
MNHTMIAFAGKGGSGKTTLAAMTLRRLIKSGVRPILAVDADPNATLGLTLGAEVGDTIADLRDRMGEAAQEVSAIPKDRLMDQLLSNVLVEEDGFDLLTMGRPEGPKCYCYVNGLLRRYLDLLRKNYACILVDCEAGMEYISRLVIDDVHTLVLVAEPTRIGMTTIKRIAGLADSLHVKVHQRVLVVNKAGQYGPLPEEVLQAAQAAAMDSAIAGVLEVPFDAALAAACAAGEPVIADSGTLAGPAVERLAEMSMSAAASTT